MTAFIFDLDGTLNDSIPLIVSTALQAYAELGIDVAEDKIKSYIGVPLLETGEHFLGPGRGREYLEAYLRHYNPANTDMHAFPGIADMLRRLKQRGAKLAIATAKRQQMARDTVEIIGLSALVDALVDCEATLRRKPFADPALKAMELLQAGPEESLFVGDSVHDILCGHHAGIPACAVTWGAGTRQELMATQPEFIVDSVAELSSLLLSRCQDNPA